MSARLSAAVETARAYYNSEDADNFYHLIWGGEDIHIGLYEAADDDIREASQRTVAAMAARLLNLDADSHVVDLGAGYGGAARWLAKTAGCRVTCVNLSEAQNARNRELTRSEGMEALIEVRDGSFEAIPYEDASFDIAWSQDSLLHSGDRGRVFREVDRVLKPRGEFIFTDPMQAEACPPGVLDAVLSRIHLESLGSLAFYRAQARELGWEELSVTDLSAHLTRHYARVRRKLLERRARLGERISADYIDRMVTGLTHWIRAGEGGHLVWGILHFRKPM